MTVSEFEAEAARILSDVAQGTLRVSEGVHKLVEVLGPLLAQSAPETPTPEKETSAKGD